MTKAKVREEALEAAFCAANQEADIRGGHSCTMDMIRRAVQAYETHLWRPASECPPGVQVECWSSTGKWLRYGRRYPEFQSRWYYSGTTEMSQYAQIEGDTPTLFRYLTAPKKGK